MHEIFRPDGKWFKGNLHMHTTLSDGHLSPEEAVAVYRDAGYDFVALTDHWVQGRGGPQGGLLVLSGCEWNTGDMVSTPVYHIVGVGMEREVPKEEIRKAPAQKIIDAIDAAGGVAILAHPAWSVTDPAEAMKLRGLCAVEVYNTLSGLPWNGARADASLYFDLWATRGKLFRCVAVDDSHYYNGEQTRSYVMVRAKECTPTALKEALRAGDFYASQGPRFSSIRCGEGRVEAEFSGAVTAVFYSNTVWCGDRVLSGASGFASYKIKPTDRYVRIELVGADGTRAWCSPIAVKEKTGDFKTERSIR